MNTTLSNQKILEQLLDKDVPFDDVPLQELTPTRVVEILRAVRGQYLWQKFLADIFSEQIVLLDVFARPRTSRGKAVHLE